MTEPKEYEATLIDRGNGDGYLIVHCKPMEVQFKVKAFPDMSMEIARPQGEWIYNMLSKECSVCHKHFEYLPDDYGDFCPNCGSDNRKEGDEK